MALILLPISLCGLNVLLLGIFITTTEQDHHIIRFFTKINPASWNKKTFVTLLPLHRLVPNHRIDQLPVAEAALQYGLCPAHPVGS
jgi:hypothetical protein